MSLFVTTLVFYHQLLWMITVWEMWLLLHQQGKGQHTNCGSVLLWYTFWEEICLFNRKYLYNSKVPLLLMYRALYRYSWRDRAPGNYAFWLGAEIMPKSNFNSNSGYWPITARFIFGRWSLNTRWWRLIYLRILLYRPKSKDTIFLVFDAD